MKPNTNRRERRAGFLAGLDGNHRAPRFRTRARRRAWWDGQAWARSVTVYDVSALVRYIDSPGGSFDEYRAILDACYADVARSLLGVTVIIPYDATRDAVYRTRTPGRYAGSCDIDITADEVRSLFSAVEKV